MSNIQKFFDGKTVFLTGGTGYVGTALIEKLLRVCSHVDKIYTVVRDKHGSTTEERYQKWCGSLILSGVREDLKKVFFLKGDLQLPRLGLSDKDVSVLANEVNCVFHLGAEVKFIDVLDRLIINNVSATNEVIQLAKNMKNLQSFVHVSTGYAQCNKPVIEEIAYKSTVSSDLMMVLLKELDSTKLNNLSPILSEGFPNTYTFTKSLAEDLVARVGADLPLAIVRPTIIGPILKDPLPGFTNRYQSYSRLVSFYALGLFHILPTRLSNIIDLVPLDYTVNLILAIAWELGSSPRCAEEPIKMYNCASSAQNPLTYGKSEELLNLNDKILPSNKKLWHRFVVVSSSSFFKKLMYAYHLPLLFLLDMINIVIGKPANYLKMYKNFHALTKTTEFFIRNTWLFKNNKAQELWQKLSSDDKKLFEFNMSTIDWNSAIHTFVDGVRLHVFGEELKGLPRAQFRRKALMVLHYVTVVGYLCFFMFVIRLLLSWCI